MNGVKRAITDKNGFYSLKNLKEGIYKLSAVKEHFEFGDLDQKISFKHFQQPIYDVKK